MISQNNKGQISKQLSVLITKELQKIATDCEQRVKIVLRDKLEEQHKHDVYSTYEPIQMSGQKVKEYNEDPYNTHKKKQPYHHSGNLIRSIHGVIDGNTVKIDIEDIRYEDGTSTKDVYEWLDKGTSNSEHDLYILGGKGSHTPYVSYWPQPRHGYKRLTLDNMDNYIKTELIPDIENGKYLRKTRKGAK